MFPAETSTYDRLHSFLKRHENLILKKSYPLEKKRAALTSEQIDQWSELLSKITKENDLVGMSDGIGYCKVLVHRRTSNAYQVQGDPGGKVYTSVMFCASATGFLLPPFVVYKSNRLFHEWCCGGPPGTGFSNSNK
ncbi:unnamed protein product [Rotaria sp. Silwood2]|nr:unnamed protein product [Rotaria sp. Silwood2]CAF4093336.1 unnamed protein product [Rotaria sp. Silwood2]